MANYFKFVGREHTMVSNGEGSKFMVKNGEVFESGLEVIYMLKNSFVQCDKDGNGMNPLKKKVVETEVTEVEEVVSKGDVEVSSVSDESVESKETQVSEEEQVETEVTEEPTTVEEARAYLKKNGIKYAGFQKLDSLLKMVKKHKESSKE